MRAHFSRPIQDQHGDLMTGEVTVEVVDPDSLITIEAPVYANATGGELVDNPTVITGGEIDFWMDDDQYVSLKVTPAGGGQILIEYLHVDKPEELISDDQMTVLTTFP